MPIAGTLDALFDQVDEDDFFYWLYEQDGEMTFNVDPPAEAVCMLAAERYAEEHGAGMWWAGIRADPQHAEGLEIMLRRYIDEQA